MSNEYDRLILGYDSSGRPIRASRRSKAMLDEVRKRSGVDFTIVQGAWRKLDGGGASASADTHDADGVFDIRSWNMDANERARFSEACEHVGFIRWWRLPPAFDEHWHIVDKGSQQLSNGAEKQVRDAAAGLNGLANEGADRSNLNVATFNYQRWLAEKSGANLTIAIKAIQMAAAGQTVTDSYLADAKQVLAWGRALGAVPTASAVAWVTKPRGWIYHQCVEWIQAHFGLKQDGIFGPVTARKMKAYGYIVTDYSGRAL